MSSSPPIAVRSLRWEDFNDLVENYFRLYSERDAGEPIGITLFGTRPSLADEASWFERAFRGSLEGDQIFLVAEVAGRVVGTCSIHRLGPTPDSELSHVGELGILVRRESRGKGVGTALLKRALAEARSKFEIVYLSVFSVNEGARRLYERFGFVVCGHFPRLVKRASRYFDEDRMVLELTQASPEAGANR